ncbi:hypothetical protein GGR56DRAFT_457807 [Xylariaceae sp. FL0804]|nr:hypothetical protein GGR56DRAFT_457807 [Xylariaceae sp. FL0804]
MPGLWTAERIPKRTFGREMPRLPDAHYISRKWLCDYGANDWCFGDPDVVRPGGQPVRCIVKDLLSPSEDYTMEMVPRMIRNMVELQKHSIFHRDVKRNNYIEGVVIDFDSSWTSPHMVFEMEDEGIFDGCDEDEYGSPALDLARIDRFVDEWNEIHGPTVWHRSQKNFRCAMKLRRPPTSF